MKFDGGVWTESIGFIMICEPVPVFDHEVPDWQFAGEKTTQNQLKILFSTHYFIQYL